MSCIYKDRKTTAGWGIHSPMQRLASPPLTKTERRKVATAIYRWCGVWEAPHAQNAAAGYLKRRVLAVVERAQNLELRKYHPVFFPKPPYFTFSALLKSPKLVDLQARQTRVNCPPRSPLGGRSATPCKGEHVIYSKHVWDCWERQMLESYCLQ